MNPCGVLVVRSVTDSGALRFVPCGAPASYVITMNGDQMFAVCHRHNGRLDRAGVRFVPSTDVQPPALPA